MGVGLAIGGFITGSGIVILLSLFRKKEFFPVPAFPIIITPEPVPDPLILPEIPDEPIIPIEPVPADIQIVIPDGSETFMLVIDN